MTEIRLGYTPSRLQDDDPAWDAWVADDPMIHAHAHSPEDALRDVADILRVKFFNELDQDIEK